MDNVSDSDFLPIGNTPETGDSTDEKFNVTVWLNRISKARQKEQNWRQRSKRCINIYRDDNTVTSNTYASPRPFDDNENSFNILWANVETLLPALFSSVPKPDVRNRYLNQDKVASDAGQVIERILTYALDLYNFPRLMKACIKDYLLTGRAVMRVRLIPQFEDQVIDVTDENGYPSLDETGAPSQKTEEVLVGQSVRCELVQWDSFIVEPAKRWEDVNWIAFIHMLSKKEFEDYFPDAPLIAAAKETDHYGVDAQYQVYEIWDKVEKKVYYIGQAEKPLKIMEDPFRLVHFWPIPEPLYSIQTNNSLVPIPEYTIYQAQAYELNQISYRITDLVKSCKFIGVYDAQQTGLNDLLKSRDSQFVPVTSNLLRQGGISSVIDSLDTSKISNILAQLYHQRDQIKSIIYEVTGISDIIRGESKASETATAQNIKASYAGLRLRDRRDNINRFIVDLLRIKAEVISTFFTAKQMEEMSGIQITPEIENLIRNDVLQAYKIDIETDSTILADMEQESQKRAALVASITQFIATVSPLVAQGAIPIETAKALLMFALQSTKISRELQDSLELIGTHPSPPPGMMGQPGMPPGMMPPGLQMQQPQGQIMPPQGMHDQMQDMHPGLMPPMPRNMQ